MDNLSFISTVIVRPSRYPTLAEISQRKDKAVTMASCMGKLAAGLGKRSRKRAAVMQLRRREALAVIVGWIKQGLDNPTSIANSMGRKRHSVAQILSWASRLGYLGRDESGRYFLIKEVE